MCGKGDLNGPDPLGAPKLTWELSCQQLYSADVQVQLIHVVLAEITNLQVSAERGEIESWYQALRTQHAQLQLQGRGNLCGCAGPTPVSQAAQKSSSCTTPPNPPALPTRYL